MIKNTLVVVAMLTSLVACSQNTESNKKQTAIEYGTVDEGSLVSLKYICEVPVDPVEENTSTEETDKGSEEEKGGYHRCENFGHFQY